jgi:hypothetical protein
MYLRATLPQRSWNVRFLCHVRLLFTTVQIYLHFAIDTVGSRSTTRIVSLQFRNLLIISATEHVVRITDYSDPFLAPRTSMKSG